MTDLDIYQPPAALAPVLPVPPASDIDSWIAVVDDVIKVANAIYDTPFVPEGLRGSVTAVSACILAGREMGIGPMTSLQNIHVIKGKPGQSALLMRSLIQSRGHKWTDVDVTDTRVTVKGCRRGESEWSEVTFTADQAKRAGIDLGKYPQDKLYARASVRLARRKFADVIMGMPYSEEDLEDGTDIDAPAPAAIEAPKAAQRTAQRRQGARPDATPTPAAPAAATDRTAAPAPAATAPAAAGMPPLPGEDESAVPPTSPAAPGPGSTGSPATAGRADKDAAGTVTRPQLTKIWTILSGQMHFSDEEKPQARAICETIIGRDLAGDSTTDMSLNEAKSVIDTLERVGTRDALMELLAAQPARSAAEIRGDGDG